jgi:hypothetical protein
MLNFVEVFFCMYWDNQLIFVLGSVYVPYYINWFAYIVPSLHPWNETNLITAYDFLNMLLNFICKYFIGNVLHLCSLRKLVYTFFLFCSIRMWYQGNFDFIAWAWLLSFLFYGIVWEAIDVSSSLKVW